MKKLIALMLCALLCALSVAALSEAPSEGLPFDPAPEETPAAPTPAPEVPTEPRSGADTLQLDVNGETVLLVYDSSPQYSSVEGGLVQASYYAYGQDGVTMYELYVIFPDSARPGMVITPEYAALTGQESSVVLIVSDEQKEDYYFASLMDGSAYPVGSSFEIAIDEVAEDGGVTYAGSLSATLVALDMSSGEVASTLSIPRTPFRFTIGGGDDNRHADPMPTELPSDMRKV